MSNVQQDTDGHETDADRRSAVRDEGQRDAGHGHERGDDGHVHPGLEHEPDRDPGRQERAGRIRRGERDPDPLEGDHQEQHDDRERAEEPELVAEDGEDRIGVGGGKVPEFLLPGTETLTERPTEGEPEDGLDRLEARAARIAPRIEEREDPLQAIRLHDRDRGDEHSGKGPEPGELHEPRPRDEVHAEGERTEDDRGPEVRFGDDERRDEAHDEHERQRHGPAADLGAG